MWSNIIWNQQLQLTVYIRYHSPSMFFKSHIRGNVKFDNHIVEKVWKTNKILGCIENTMFEPSPNVKLFTCISLYRPIYDDMLWDPFRWLNSNSSVVMQNKADHFIENCKGIESVLEAGHGLPPLEDWHVESHSLWGYSLMRKGSMRVLWHTIKFSTIKNTSLLSHKLLLAADLLVTTFTVGNLLVCSY